MSRIGGRAASPRGWLRRAYRAILARLHRGDRVECPCCGGRFSRFLPFGVVRRENARCPGCGSLERHRLLWLHLERRTDLFRAPRRILHVAPEPRLAERLRAVPGARWVGADLDSPLASARADLARLPFRDGAFEVALCLHVLEHVGDDRAAMRELRRVLAPGGWAILQSPVDPGRAATYEDPTIVSAEARERAFGQRDHVRVYGRDYPERLREAGFVVEESALARELDPAEAERFGLDLEETLTLCR